MKKVLFILNAMHVGGTEKAFLNLINELSPEENDITLTLLEKAGGFLSYVPYYVHINVIEGYPSIRHEIMEPPLQIAKKYIREGRMTKAFGILFAHFVYKITDANCNNKLSIQLVRSLLFEEDPAQLRREP